MKLGFQKSIIALLTGAVILAGAVSPFIVQAAQTADQLPAVHQQQLSADEMAARTADIFDIDQSAILKYHSQGYTFSDLNRAAFLAKAGGKSLDEVLTAKTAGSTWKDVCVQLGITKEQMKATHQDIMATQLNKKLGFNKQTTLSLLQQGYHIGDITVATQLALNSNKSVTEILSLKKINNTWHDVAQSIGIDDNTYRQDMRQIRQAFPYR
ncbi:Hypothetical protein LUCI_1642 [Lucifera butyrica]|uniref:Uncharacterized protein n=1 Tax=Lucifera butyrica TaxID=1351585 RepID=A0A498R4P2_9FIRM|nr:hypothetical protein [Lucifera butyrica]VBB06411.1 Hypothetical protein LUCI_1642 [Lucifera butyrica]